MKHARKLASLLLALVMVFALATTAFAQEVNVATGSGSITISNAAKGETYKIYKLFNATVNADGTSIAYTGTIPQALEAYFNADTNGYISATAAAKDGENMSEGLKTALKAWTTSATATASAKSNGSALTFQNIPYGYYVVTTTQGGQVISVDSTMPDVTIVDKNSSTPSNLTKTAGKDDVNIGDTVTYTVSFKTSNYDGAGADAKEIVSYTIEDTLPQFLKDVIVTSIIVDNDGNAATPNDRTNVTAQFVNKKIEIDWYDESKTQFLYDNGATVTITYTAVVTEKAAIDGEGNTNKVTVKWTKKGESEPGSGKLEQNETIYTYAIALKKVDDKGNALAGAVFQFPFYVKTNADADGAYIYAGSYTAEEYSQLAESQKAAITNTITTPANGVIVVKGVSTGTYSITEVAAPAGYNKLTAPVSVTAQKTNQTTTNTTFYLDENGDIVTTATDTTVTVNVSIDKIAATAIVVVNKTGALLPSTGGMGTTIFYVLGSILAVGAIVLLVTKKRMNASDK